MWTRRLTVSPKHNTQLKYLRTALFDKSGSPAGYVSQLINPPVEGLRTYSQAIRTIWPSVNL